jgi:hypothetical protein
MLMAVAAIVFVYRTAAANTIYVTTTTQKISSTGGCSLQEAIYAANFHLSVAIASYSYETHVPNVVSTQCAPGSGDDVIILPANALFQLHCSIEDADNAMGPTATPMITSKVRIEGNGSTLQNYPGNPDCPGMFGFGSGFRLFAVGSTGFLDLRNACVKDFLARGGDGVHGGGGGMGAGGAIYVQGGGLVVSASTFEANGAIGGAGGGKGFGHTGGGGGGGGISGRGGFPEDFDNPIGGFASGGGGGGGSRGNGGNGKYLGPGGGGGGTVFAGFFFGSTGGFDCGGAGGSGAGNDFPGSFGSAGHDAPCPGGGGGGGGEGFLFASFTPFGNAGGNGSYGGGGGGGSNHGGDGGNGGFGGGGGAGWSGAFDAAHGGNGGFGGGGGSAADAVILGSGSPGLGGMYGGDATKTFGGGGGALGGAIFNDSGTVEVVNSTFYNNYVARGVGGGYGTSGAADNGADAGGAIFSVNGHLTVQNATIFHNQSTGSGGGIVVVQTDENSPTSLIVENTIIYKNGSIDDSDNLTGGASECSIPSGFVVAVVFAGNLIQNNDNCLNADGSGVVSSDDPQLGNLQNNGGLTPTMAIPQTSPAWNTADPTTSLGVDQRGEPRPQMGGYDIGAYELCVPDFSFSPVTAMTVPLVGTASTIVTINSAACFFNQQVDLAVSGQPSGVTVSLNPVAVTPAVGGSANSTLTVTLAPSVTPQTFALTVTGTSGEVTHSVQVNVTVQATPGGIVNVINEDLASGCIDNSGDAQSLLAKVNSAQTLINRGQVQAAINTLTALLKELQGVAGQQISAACASALIADVEALLASLGAQTKANPIMGTVVNSSKIAVHGATVNLLTSVKTVVATAVTDSMGFYYFAGTNGLISGVNYTVNVTLPKGYKSSMPASQTFTWRGKEFTLPNFVLY